MKLFLMVCYCMLILKITYNVLRYIFDWKALPFTSSQLTKEPLVSVLVPMRNEEKAIIASLTSLCSQTYKNLEIIVIDDCSEDNSKTLVKEFIARNPQKNIQLVEIQTLPDGWVGKCHALVQGLTHAHGEWFLFTDADVIYKPEAVKSAVQFILKEKGEFLSLKFRKICIGFWEKVIVPYTYFVKGWFAPSPSKIGDISVPAATATGDFTLIARDAYVRFGGHSHPNVKQHVIEDAAIARAAKENGVIPIIMDGKNHIEVRKFNNLKEIFAGFGKMISIEFQKKTIVHYLIQIFMISAFSIIPFILLFTLKNAVLAGLNISIILIVVGVYAIYLKKEEHPQYYNMLAPLGACMLVIICTYSLIQVRLAKGVNWRGRVYYGDVNAK